MKNFKLLLLLFTAVSIGLASCKKSGPEPKPDTQAQTEAKSKILGKWFITKAVFTANGEDATPNEYTEFDATQFFNFKSDLTVDISYKVKNGTFTYTFSEDAKTLSTSSPNDNYQIKVLTDTQLILLKNHTGDPKMTEEITFKK